VTWPRSLKLRLTLWYALALAVVMAAYGGFVYLSLRHTLFADLDDRLHEDIEVLPTIVRLPDGVVRWSAYEHGEGEADAAFLEVLAADGRLLYRSPGFRDGSGMRVRAETSTVDGERVQIRAARSEDPIEHELGELLAVLVLGLPLGVGVAAGGGYLLARRALRPVGRMAERAETITADRLSERLPIENPHDEMGRLAAVFNATLARLESSFDRLRRFTADASHEMRTPLAALKAVGEVGLREAREPAAYREVIGSMLEEVDRLARLVDSLLTLSRADAGKAPVERTSADLAGLAEEVRQLLAVLADEKRQVVRVEGEGPVFASCDRAILRQAVVNLLDNAIRHSPDGRTIRVAVERGPKGPSIAVIDEGPGIAPEHLPRIFDRFYRIDPARSREAGGTGLGLAIARWAVEANGGRIEVESEVGRGSTFRIVLKEGNPSEE
jgi:heavy metal sensor kinase